MHGVEPLPAAQGLHGLQGFAAAHGLQGLATAHGLQGFADAQGLQGLQPSPVTAQGLQLSLLVGFALAQGFAALEGWQPFLLALGLGCAWVIPGFDAAQGLQSLQPARVPAAAADKITALASVVAFLRI